MSLAMKEEESPSVTGTLIKTGTGEDALEVVFALREVRFYLGWLWLPTDHTLHRPVPSGKSRQCRQIGLSRLMKGTLSHLLAPPLTTLKSGHRTHHSRVASACANTVRRACLASNLYHPDHPSLSESPHTKRSPLSTPRRQTFR
jgi:hypothetical protein